MSLMIGLPSVQPVDGIFDSITSAIANVVTGGPNEGDYYDVTLFGRKVPASQVFNADFTKVRTPVSVQSLANIISQGNATVRDDGSVTGLASGMLAPPGSVKVAAFRALQPTAQAAGIGVPSVAAPPTVPVWVMDSFVRVATADRLQNILTYLRTGAAVVREDGSVGVPNRSEVIAPAGSINVATYRSMTGGRVYPVAAITAPGVAAPVVTGPGTVSGTAGTPTTIGGALGSILSGVQSAAVTLGQQYVQAKVTDFLAKNAPTTDQQRQAAALEAERLRLQNEAAQLQSQFQAAQLDLQRQALAQQDAANRARLEAEAAAAKARHDAELAQRQAEIERLRRESESVRVTSSLPVGGNVVTPALIQPMGPIFTPSVSPSFPTSSFAPAGLSDLSAEIETRSETPFVSPTSRLPGWVWGVGAGALALGVILMTRQTGGGRRRRR